jgi:hypothetical protein
MLFDKIVAKSMSREALFAFRILLPKHGSACNEALGELSGSISKKD